MITITRSHMSIMSWHLKWNNHLLLLLNLSIYLYCCLIKATFVRFSITVELVHLQWLLSPLDVPWTVIDELTSSILDDSSSFIVKLYEDFHIWFNNTVSNEKDSNITKWQAVNTQVQWWQLQTCWQQWFEGESKIECRAVVFV